jgi:hypothetical protein
MQLMDVINSAGGIGAIARQVGLSESQAQAGAAALLPALVGGFKKQAATGGIESLTSLLNSAGGTGLLENVLSPGPTDVNLGQNILGQIFGSKDVSRTVASHAAESSGVSADALKKMLPLLAMVASGVMAAQQGGAQAGGAGGLLGQLGGLLGGNAAPGNAAPGAAGGLGKLLDLDGDGNALDDIAGLAGKFFGR